MKNETLLLVGLAGLLLCSGCEPVPHYNRIQAASLTGAPVKVPSKQRGHIKPYGTVRLFQSPAEIPGKYRAIAVMSLEGRPGDEARFINAFLYRAADLGADGILFYREGTGTIFNGGGGWFNGSGFASAKGKLEGVYRAEAIVLE